MSGLTLPEAVVAVGSIIGTIAGIVALFKGGDAQKDRDTMLPMAAVGAHMVDRAMSEDMIEALHDIARAVRESTTSREHSDSSRMVDKMNEVLKKIDKNN